MRNNKNEIYRTAIFTVMTAVFMTSMIYSTVNAALPVPSQKGIGTAEQNVFVGDANNPRSYCNTGTPSTDDKVFPTREQRGSTTRCK